MEAAPLLLVPFYLFSPISIDYHASNLRYNAITYYLSAQTPYVLRTSVKMTAPSGSIPRDLLKKNRAQIEPENIERGLLTNGKTVKVLKTERIMYELQVPQHLWADMISSLAASDMADGDCYVATLQGYLSDAGRATNDASKAGLIEAIFKYWVQAGDLSSVNPIDKKGTSSRPSSKSRGETASAMELATPVTKHGVPEDLPIPRPRAVAYDPPTAEGTHLGIRGSVVLALDSAPAGPEEREISDAYRAKYAPDQNPRVPAGSRLSPLSFSHLSTDEFNAWVSSLTTEELEKQAQFSRAQIESHKKNATADAIFPATQNRNDPGIAYSSLAPQQDKDVEASSTGSIQRSGQPNPASFYGYIDQAVGSTRVGGTPYDSVHTSPELQNRENGAALTAPPQRSYQEPPKLSILGKRFLLKLRLILALQFGLIPLLKFTLILAL
ncbi:hypothetical protein GGS24DRAFT_510768 [Hypoxylon argillaceum]|nr:hypothetical protein GGS24DRAFT_510768 [Hypoxylon argillaceum]